MSRLCPRRTAGALARRGRRLLAETLCRDAVAADVPVAFVPADIEDAHAIVFYLALGGRAAPVAIFIFEDGVLDRPSAS